MLSPKISFYVIFLTGSLGFSDLQATNGDQIDRTESRQYALVPNSQTSQDDSFKIETAEASSCQPKLRVGEETPSGSDNLREPWNGLDEDGLWSTEDVLSDEDELASGWQGGSDDQSQSLFQIRATGLDPVLRQIVDVLVENESVKKIAGDEIRIQAFVKRESKEDDQMGIEGVDSPLLGVFEKWGPVSFSVRVKEGADKKISEAVMAERVRSVGKLIEDQIASINGMFYDAVIFGKAEELAELELEALDKQVTFETIRLEAGVGRPEKLAIARARAVQAEVDLAMLSRQARHARNEFITKTGVSVGELVSENIFPLNPADIDFYSIAKRAITQSRNTEEASKQIQKIASDLLFNGEALIAQSLCVEAAAMALKKVQGEMGSGKSGEAELAGAEAMLLGSQKKKMIALSSYIRSHLFAYPGSTVDLAVSRAQGAQGAVGSYSLDEAKKRDGFVWFVVVSGGLLILVAIIGASRSSGGATKREGDSNP
jgi:hypothetical protein